jgi:hypothetical protein
MDYTELITSQHRDKPKFRDLVGAVSGCFSDISALHLDLVGKFDIDTAVGDQLDIIGKWVGLSRKIRAALLVYFSFDTAGLGFDEGNIQGPFDPSTGLVSLDDETYRVMLKARIGANHWDGTMPALSAVYSRAFAGTGATVFAVDNQDMSMDFYIVGSEPSALMAELLKGGYFPLKPAGVRINGYTKPSVAGAPLFGFDIQNEKISGFDTGAIGIPL